jgi:hypothetical protein
MKLRHLLLAAFVMAFTNLASAQAVTASASVKADPNTPVYSDPIVQKRHADRAAKAEYKAAKKAAKQKMKEEKSVAKSEMKADKEVANAVMKESLATPSTVSGSVK